MEILEKSVKNISIKLSSFHFIKLKCTFNNEMIMRRLQSLNQENKNIRSQNFGLNNSAGFVNSCI